MIRKLLCYLGFHKYEQLYVKGPFKARINICSCGHYGLEEVFIGEKWLRVEKNEW